MTNDIYRFTFNESVPMEEVEASLVLALLATESLHGEARVRLDAAIRTCVVDAGSAVGADLVRLFVGFLSREVGPDAFRVERIDTARGQPPARPLS